MVFSAAHDALLSHGSVGGGSTIPTHRAFVQRPYGGLNSTQRLRVSPVLRRIESLQKQEGFALARAFSWPTVVEDLHGAKQEVLRVLIIKFFVLAALRGTRCEQRGSGSECPGEWYRRA